MPINFGESTLQSFMALKPQKPVYIATLSKIQDSYRIYLPKEFVSTFGITKGTEVFLTYSETEDLLHLKEPDLSENFPFQKKVKVQSASFSTCYILLPKKLMLRYKEQVTKITLVQLDTTQTFKLLFYKE